MIIAGWLPLSGVKQLPLLCGVLDYADALVWTLRCSGIHVRNDIVSQLGSHTIDFYDWIVLHCSPYSADSPLAYDGIRIIWEALDPAAIL